VVFLKFLAIENMPRLLAACLLRLSGQSDLILTRYLDTLMSGVTFRGGQLYVAMLADDHCHLSSWN